MVLFCCVGAGIIMDKSVSAESEGKISIKENLKKESIKLKMSEEKWKEKLTPEQYRILAKPEQSDLLEKFIRNLKSKVVELMFVRVVIQNCSAQMRNLIRNVVGRLFMTLQKLKMLKLPLIICWDTQEPKYFALFVMDI